MSQYSKYFYKVEHKYEDGKCVLCVNCDETKVIKSDEFGKPQDYHLISCILQVNKLDQLNDDRVWKEISSKCNFGQGGPHWSVLKERYFKHILQNLSFYNYCGAEQLDRLIVKPTTKSKKTGKPVEKEQTTDDSTEVEEDDDYPSQESPPVAAKPKKKVQDHYLQFLHECELEQEEIQARNNIRPAKKATEPIEESETDSCDSITDPDEKDDENIPSTSNKQTSNKQPFKVITKSNDVRVVRKGKKSSTPSAKLNEKVDDSQSSDEEVYIKRKQEFQSKQGQIRYTHDEDLEILKHAISYARRGEKYLKGREFWQRLQVRTNGLEKVSGYTRTWQSMKERFIKKILPQLYEHKVDYKDAKAIIRSTSMDPRLSKSILSKYKE